jgi:hypothetical protein
MLMLVTGGQPRADVLRLGRRRPRQLPADRVLVPQAERQRRGDQGFVVNRVGDLGFMLGIFGTFLVFQTVSIPEILAAAPACRAPRTSPSSACGSTR